MIDNMKITIVVNITMLLLVLINFNLTGQEISTIEIYANDFVYNHSNNKLYAIIGSNDSTYQNSLVVIDPKTKMIEESIALDKEPICMEMTKSFENIYVGYDSASIITRIKLNPLQVLYNINLGNDGNIDYYAEDLTSLNNRDDIVIVSRKHRNYSPRHAGVVVYKGQTKLVNETTKSPSKNIIISANDTNLIFGLNYETTSNEFSRMEVDTVNGISLIDIPLRLEIHQFDGRMKLYDSLLYFDEGIVLNPFLLEPNTIGKYEGFRSYAKMDISLNYNKSYFVSQEFGKVYFYHFNKTTFEKYGRELIEYITPSATSPISIIALEKYSENGIAFIVNENYLTPIRRIVFYEGCNILPSTNLKLELNYVNDSTINLIASNLGQLVAKRVNVIDTLPNQVVVDTAIYSRGTINFVDNVFTWSIDSLMHNESDTLKMVLSSSICENSVIEIRSNIESETIECDFSNNEKEIQLFLKGQICNDLPHTVYNSNGKPYEIYPNPINDLFYVQCSELKTIGLLDMSGKLIKEWYPLKQPNISTFNISTLTPGIYIIRIQTESNIYNSKIMKK